MSSNREKGPGVVKRWKQAIGRFIVLCLYGDQSPLQAAEAKRRRAELVTIQRPLDLNN
jgi:hypothetical protein